MGVYHCDVCNETMCGISYSCEICDYAGGDGNTLCEKHAELHCKTEAEKEQGNIPADVELLSMLTWGGVYTDNDKFAREKSIKSNTVKEILKLIVNNPTRLQELLPTVRKVFSEKGVNKTIKVTFFKKEVNTTAESGSDLNSVKEEILSPAIKTESPNDAISNQRNMPNDSKRPKLGFESDPDSGKEEKLSPPVKTENPNDCKSSGGPTMENGEPTWELGQNKKIKIREFRGNTLIDFRQFYDDRNTGETKPGKKGIALHPAQFQQFRNIIDEINSALP